MSTEQILHVLLGWLAHLYPHERVPFTLVRQMFPGVLQVAPAQVLLAAQLGQQRNWLATHGRDASDLVLSLTAEGRQMGEEIVRSLDQKSKVGVPSSTAEAHIKSIVSAFERDLRETAKSWASQASSPVEPLHVYLAAKSLAAGTFAESVEKLDAKRDKSGDHVAERQLLDLLWKREGDGS